MRISAAALVIFSLAATVRAAENGISPRVVEPVYIWEQTPIARNGELLTLFCRGCAGAEDGDVPLLAVLRDSLGDEDLANDRISDIWLLSYRLPGIGQRLLSAVPFFYWRVEKNAAAGNGKLAPLLDMNSLQHPAANALTQNLLQWTVLNPSTMPVRASSRAFRANAADEERLHLQEAVSYLRQAPAAEDSPLTQKQLHTLIARLELRKSLLGGFVSERAAAAYGESAGLRYEQIRERNWELLRQWADKTGLYFEPLPLAGTRGEYAALWAPRSGVVAETGSNVAPIWKLLNLKRPKLGELARIPAADVYERSLDENGNLLPAGDPGSQRVEMVPLGIYSLDYPKVPLLMVDFRHGGHLRWHAVMQRSINEVTAGIIGISHFTNWYYYVGADLYDFVASRHGSPMNQSERLDCYSQFRVRMALDRELDPRLRAQAQARINSLAMNPLESSPEAEMAAARANYARLQAEVSDGDLAQLLDRNRRRELASWDSSRVAVLRHEMLHVATFGKYTPEVKSSETIAAQVSVMRRAQYELQFLNQLAQQNTPPEVALDGSRIAASVAELEQLLPEVKSERFRETARQTIARLKTNSQDTDLQAQCGRALVALHSLDEAKHEVALKPSVVHVPASE